MSVKPLLNSHRRSVCSTSAHSATSPQAAVHDIIVDHAIDLFVVVSWPHDSAESPSDVAATPPPCYVVKRARPRTTAASLALNETAVCMEQPACHCSQLSDQPRRSARNSLPTELRLLRSTINFHHRQKIPVDSAYIWTPGNRQTDGCFVMRPWSPSSAVSQ